MTLGTVLAYLLVGSIILKLLKILIGTPRWSRRNPYGLIYCFHDPRTATFKIGFTRNNVYRRKAQVEQEYGVRGLRVAWTRPGSMSDEAALHHQYRHQRIGRYKVNGRVGTEWFRCR